MFYKSGHVKKLLQPVSVFRVHVELFGNVSDAEDEFFGRCITCHFGKCRIDGDKTSFRCTLKKTFDSIFKYAPIFSFTLPQLLFGRHAHGQFFVAFMDKSLKCQ